MTPPGQPLATALQCFQEGRLHEAETICRQALGREPADADALHLLGVIAHRSGNNHAAVGLLRQAVASCPANGEFHYNLGVALQLAGSPAEAAASYREALRLQPDRTDAHNNLGMLALGAGRHAEARDRFRQALACGPAHVEAHNNLGVALRELGQSEEAEACFHQALRLKPDHAGAHNNLGRLCQDRGRLDEAAARFRLALCYQPDDAATVNNLANVLLAQAKPAEALPLYERAVRLQPAEAVYHSNLAHALTLLGRPDDGEACCRQALRLRPDLADAHHNLAITLSAQGRVTQALACNEEALRLQPEYPGARNCRALWWLQTGDFERGWPEYEWRWRIKGVEPRTFARPAWDGSPPAGRTVLLHAEQGLGDTVQFIRYAPLVRQRGGTVVVECQPPLARLLAGCPGIDRLVPRGAPLPDFDVHAALMSLPRLLGTTLADVPADVPYLFPDPALLERWRRELCGDRSFKVGVAWQGNPGFPGDPLRSIPLRHFAPLARVEGVRLYALQKGPGREQLQEAARQFPLTDLGPRLDEAAGAFMDTAAVMKCLDLVVTSDTAVAHLAGALGVPVWVALAVGPDWRWLLGREDCPWYPTMRLFRQRRLHDWDEVFERLAAELRGLAAPAPQRAVTVPVAPGELLDKVAILEIKAERMTDPAKLRNVRAELAALREACALALPASDELAALAADLKAVNEALWQIEDDLRLCERHGDFGPRFVELARSVYRTNDRRGALKRRITTLVGSDLIEEKAYAAYEPEP